MHNTKYWSFELSRRANLISSGSENIWVCGATLNSTLRKSKSVFLGKVLSKNDIVAFSDGSWSRIENSIVGLDGAVINKDMNVLYVYFGPCNANCAFLTELFSVMHVTKAYEKINKEFRIWCRF